METLDCILHYLANFSMIGCSVIWMLCCLICFKVYRQISQRIDLYESVIEDFHKRISGFEYTLLMRRINGNFENNEEEEKNASN